MRNRAKRGCVGALCLTIVLAASTANAGPIATPGDYSLTVYAPNFSVVYQVEQSAATINPSTIYELFPETSITVGSNSDLLPNVSIFSSGALEFPNPLPTAIYAAGGNPVTGPWDAIFGLVYNSSTQTWDGNSINYFLGFAAGPPGTGTALAPDGAGTYVSEATGPFFSATQYLSPALQSAGYTAYFYDPASVVASVPEPSSLALTLGASGAALAVTGMRRLRSRGRRA
jgi:hypothetical protein